MREELSEDNITMQQVLHPESLETNRVGFVRERDAELSQVIQITAREFFVRT